jgi:hypothetical protein
MYSGTTLRRASGRIIGAHQKIDRVSRRYLKRVLPHVDFPGIKQILHFEGINGPDGIKRKSPAKDEPWHYIDPADHSDTALLEMIEDHSYNLTKALKEENHERAAFEAAWLAHTIVDGLTPAHHYPLEEKLEELRGEGLETRTSFKDKVVMPGDNRRDQFRKNWEFWGAKGVMTTHGLFEIGVATTIAALRLNNCKPNQNELIRARSDGIVPIFVETLLHIHSLKMYETFHKKGWNQKLARQTREILIPLIIKTVTLAWYAAAYNAERTKEK